MSHSVILLQEPPSGGTKFELGTATSRVNGEAALYVDSYSFSVVSGVDTSDRKNPGKSPPTFSPFFVSIPKHDEENWVGFTQFFDAAKDGVHIGDITIKELTNFGDGPTPTTTITLTDVVPMDARKADDGSWNCTLKYGEVNMVHHEFDPATAKQEGQVATYYNLITSKNEEGAA
ncbi:MAG: hypothetical protein ACI9WU_003771 [Myxococcota bacterium]|jgi:hypothetical protein